MPTRREFIKHTASLAVPLSLADDVTNKVVNDASVNDTVNAASKRSGETTAADGLHRWAAEKNMFFGTATADERIMGDKAYRDAVVQECGIIVPEYEMKWDKLRPTPTTWNFSDADYIMNFARQNRLAVRGHTLCWHRALPAWFSSTINKTNAARYLTEHITTLLTRYRGQIHSWDVVNEAIERTDNKPNGLRNSVWYQLLGEEYIELAFRTAAQADPNALLTYNEYGVEFDDAARRDAILGLLRRLKTNNVPVHALGIQGHLSYAALQKFSANTNSFRTFLRDVAALGLKIIITEFDCDDSALPTDVSRRDASVAQVYGDYCSVVMNEPAVIGFMTWGLSDKYTSLNTTARRSDGQPQRPLPLDAAMTRKSSWYSLEWWFKNTSKRPAQTITSVHEQGAQQAPLLSVTCFPNPVAERLFVDVALAEAASLRVSVVNVLGREHVIAEQFFTRGTHRFEWETARDAMSVDAGAYTCVVQHSSGRVTVPFVVRK